MSIYACLEIYTQLKKGTQKKRHILCVCVWVLIFRHMKKIVFMSLGQNKQQFDSTKASRAPLYVN